MTNDNGVGRRHTASVLRLMDIVYQKGPITRRRLKEASGFSTPTIIGDVARLIAAGLVSEVPSGDDQPRRGPRPAELRARGDNRLIVSVEVRSNLMIGIVMDFDGRVLHRTRQISRSRVREQTVAHLLTLVENLLSLAESGPVRAICVAFPGYIGGDFKVVHTFHGREGWDNYPLAETIQERFGIETFLINNSNAYIRAEKHFVYQSSEKNLLGIYLDNAMSMGIVVNGQVYEGETFAAGEIGHLPYGDRSESCHCGGNGCVERFCTEMYLLEKMNARLGTSHPTIRDVLDTLDLNSADGYFVRRLLADGLEVLSRGIASAVTLLNPAKVLIHGGIVPLAPHYLDVVRDSVRRNSYPASANAEIVLSSLDETACALGAGVLFIERFYNINLDYLSAELESA